jgi:uncharacterized phage protein (TIGR02218 family)
MPRTISVALKAHLAGSPTTLAVCVRVTRTDGTEYFFTSHDTDITYDGDVYQAGTALVPSDLDNSGDMEPDNMEVQLVFDAAEITEEDVRRFKFDGARILTFIVNYNDLTMGNMILPSAWFGEVTIPHDTGRFRVELLGLADIFKRTLVELTSPTCRFLKLGDAKCGVNLAGNTADTSLSITTNGTVTSVQNARLQFTASALAARPNAFYKNAHGIWTGGDNDGVEFEVKDNTGGAFTLKYRTPYAIQTTDTFTVYAGCQRRFTQDCVAKFANGARFGGEPLVPGQRANEVE